MERKLAAILHADVKGYSCLMGEDEEATLRILNSYRRVRTPSSRNTAKVMSSSSGFCLRFTRHVLRFRVTSPPPGAARQEQVQQPQLAW
jgi:hypothetical protein